MNWSNAMLLIGDVHGCYNTLRALLAKVPEHHKKHGIVICGDIVDRGPKTKQVIQYCIDNKITVIRGNHEDLMINDIDYAIRHWDIFKNTDFNSDRIYRWSNVGGRNTLKSYIIYENEQEVLDIDTLRKHVEWLKKTPYYKIFKKYKKDDKILLASHASFEPAMSFKDRHNTTQDHKAKFKEIITWNRTWPVVPLQEYYNVFGHTPQMNGPDIQKHYACIDTGCPYGQKWYSRLTALKFPEMEIYTQENIDGTIPA